ncbi:antibiotic biosynthesis monooxygenase [Mycoplasma sp. 2045]|uniref:putative quinol monooxygenase n=1 Tax=unclassified Mycoplasma TaxID=2683645 RepID=UPI00211C9818|nr:MULTISPECIES: antibiotic biosynthesis monooxygenase [unclassified Mycoplasma]MEA4134461.1 antibiotic biosynthesis monooxygenase [Mycoplasma sp. 2704]UUM20580.1 antibiotic biosynthesis monooxygenase [Mycoplasma sp. 2045]
MIFAKASRYVINPEKLKGFIDYLFILTKKTRMKEENLSFEYSVDPEGVVIVLERWSTRLDYEKFMQLEEFKQEFKTLNKMCKLVNTLYDVDLVK